MSTVYSARPTAERCRTAAAHVARAETNQKNAVLRRMARLLQEHCDEVVAANERDREEAKQNGISGALLERLVFDEIKLANRVEALEQIAALPDPVGQISRLQRRPNGLTVGRMRVPLGVILMIYEARPHVTVNGGAFALKSGNAIMLRGGSEARQCNGAIGRLWSEALQAEGFPKEAIEVVPFGHEAIGELLELDDLIDLVIPRGGKGLIETVRARSKIPVIKHFEGICHVYVGQDADERKASDIVLDSKLLMPAVCNAAETVLVDASMRAWLPTLAEALSEHGVQVRGCPIVCDAVPGATPATEEDWGKEYLDLIYSVKVVEGLDAAVEHIGLYGSGHTDVIVTENYSHAQRFMREVDSSVVLVNASTMFCDGASLGMGAEIGISTDKLHARGPMGLEELTSYKHVIWGEGQVMGSPDAWEVGERT